MAKYSQRILDLARRGAQQRYAELKVELDYLKKHFPDLSSIMRKGGKAVMATVSGNQPPRKRRRMSPAARKRISDAQKARWATLKASRATVHKAGKKR
jgi:hypothetical protein